jgi:hypothetical protein
MQHPIDPAAQDVPPVSPPADSVTACGQPSAGSREQEAPQNADGTEQKAAAVPVPTPPQVGASQASAQQDRYDYDRTSIILVAHFRPVTQDGQPRQVWLSAQNGVGNEQDFPLYRVLSEADLGGPWPPAVAQLLENLRQDLPARRQRYEARQATKPAATAAPSSPARHPIPAATTSTRHGKVQAKPAETNPAAPAPIPTTSTPIPKQELAIAGLFEELE